MSMELQSHHPLHTPTLGVGWGVGGLLRRGIVLRHSAPDSPIIFMFPDFVIQRTMCNKTIAYIILIYIILYFYNKNYNIEYIL